MPLLIAAGLIGVPLAIAFLARRDQPDPNSTAVEGEPSTADTATAYPMNHYLPGAGYYHAPYHAWFPFPFGFHDASRGWYRGGQWRTAATPDDNERRDEQRASGFAGRSTGGTPASRTGNNSAGNAARVMTSRPSAEAVSRANSSATSRSSSVTRGGFGSSSRPAIS